MYTCKRLFSLLRFSGLPDVPVNRRNFTDGKGLSQLSVHLFLEMRKHVKVIGPLQTAKMTEIVVVCTWVEQRKGNDMFRFKI